MAAQDASSPPFETSGDGTEASRATDGSFGFTNLLFEEHGFAGNADDYYDARNSYLNDVLDRKLGIPITLSVAGGGGRRPGRARSSSGSACRATSSPRRPTPSGHDVLFDPFNGGQFLDAAGCEELVSAVTGQPFELTARRWQRRRPG